MSQASGASPGGPRHSSAKRRRLAALDQSLSAATPTTKRAAAPLEQQAPSAAGRARSPAPSSAASAQQQQQQLQQGRGAGLPSRRARQVARPSPSAASAAGGAPPPAGGSAAAASDGGPREPLYRRLCELGLDGDAGGPLAAALGLPAAAAARDGRVVAALLEGLMSTNPRAFDARGAIALKVGDRTLMLDNPAAAAPARGGGGRGRRRALARRLARRREQRAQGLYDLSAAGLTYEAVLPLHRRWQQYMQRLLQGAAPAAAQRGVGGAAAGAAGSLMPSPAASGAACLEDRLVAADMHGCLLRAAETRDPRYQGAQGIVVRDTQQTFQLVTPDDRLRVVPKAAATWEYDTAGGHTVTLMGPGLVAAAGGRAGPGRGGGGAPARRRGTR